MLEAMRQARVGDDVFGEDETVNALQDRLASTFEMEAALFCPTGTMSNQIAIKVHTQPGDELICHELAHVYLYEGGGIAFHSGASVRLLQGDNGRFTAEQIHQSVNRRDDSHQPWTRLVSIENTVNRGGGACWDLAEIARVREACQKHDLALHLDGARLYNALVARNEHPRQHARHFDSVSICLSKGLGAPAGSLLLGDKEMIGKAHRVRKLMGGGMRQAGYLAAAGLYALDHHVARLEEDHSRAKRLARDLEHLPWIETVLPVETNIVIARLCDSASGPDLIRHLHANGIRASGMGRDLIRFVFHLDVNDDDLEKLRVALRKFV